VGVVVETVAEAAVVDQAKIGFAQSAIGWRRQRAAGKLADLAQRRYGSHVGKTALQSANERK